MIRGEFHRRLNRFVCEVKLPTGKVKALLRNTGRLGELLTAGREVYVREKDGGKYAYELILVRGESSLVCVDSHLPPVLFLEFLKRESRPWKVENYLREVKVGSSRFDLLINGSVLVETKSVNLVRDGVALFPDAPTRRGRKHITELLDLGERYKPAIVFVIQRGDARSFSPNTHTDPLFSEALRTFRDRGFTVKALACEVSTEEIYIKGEIPVEVQT